MEPREFVPVSLEPDPVIEAYKKDVDRTLLRENLKLTPDERMRQLVELQRFAEDSDVRAGSYVAADFERLLATLREGNVEFIVIGGAAAIVHGSARLTLDLDVVYRRTRDNIQRLVSALAPLEPYLRGAPPGLPFRWDSETIRRGLNFTLVSAAGDIDVLGEIVGGGRYDDLLPNSAEAEVFGQRCLCLGLTKLIEVKRAAGRPKDLEAIAELEAIREESGR